MDTGTDTAEFIIQTLDFAYPKREREDVDLFLKLEKYRQARLKSEYDVFVGVIKGMVGNG